MNILKIHGAQYKDSKGKANKVGDALAERYLPQNYDPTFLELKQNEEQKTIHVNHNNEENDNKPLSKEELTQAMQNTENSAPDFGKIHN